MRQRCELQELEIQRSAKKTQEAMALAAEESSKSRAAKEVIKSLAAQVKFWLINLSWKRMSLKEFIFMWFLSAIALCMCSILIFSPCFICIK